MLTLSPCWHKISMKRQICFRLCYKSVATSSSVWHMNGRSTRRMERKWFPYESFPTCNTMEDTAKLYWLLISITVAVFWHANAFSFGCYSGHVTRRFYRLAIRHCFCFTAQNEACNIGRKWNSMFSGKEEFSQVTLRRKVAMLCHLIEFRGSSEWSFLHK